MSKMSELSLVLDEMVSCGEGLIKAANTLREIFSDSPAENTVAKTEDPTVPEKEYTAEETRGVLSKVSALGFSSDVRTILGKYGASKFSGLDSKHYAAVVAEAEALING